MKFNILRKVDELYHKLFKKPGTFLWFHFRFMCNAFDYHIASQSWFTPEEIELMKIDDHLNAIETREKYKKSKELSSL